VVSLAFMAIAAATLLAPDPATDKRDVGGWKLSRAKDHCTTEASWEGGFYLGVAYYKGTDTAKVAFAAPHFRSIEKGKEYSIAMDFVRGNKLDSGWGVTDGTGFTSTNANGVVFTFDGDDFLKDLSANEFVGFKKGDQLIASLALKNSTMAVLELRKCANEVERANPTDPFAQ
jgi:hypothetical protein